MRDPAESSELNYTFVAPILPLWYGSFQMRTPHGERNLVLCFGMTPEPGCCDSPELPKLFISFVAPILRPGYGSVQLHIPQSERKFSALLGGRVLQGFKLCQSYS